MPTELIICTTCRPAGAAREEPAAGELLLDAVELAQLLDDEARHTHVRVRGVACISSCSRACSVALQAAGKHTYLFGDLVPDVVTAMQLLDCASLHAGSADGVLMRNDRPERLRSGILMRIPPLATPATADS